MADPDLNALRGDISGAAKGTVASVSLAQRDVEHWMHALAAEQSAAYVLEHMPRATPMRDREARGDARFVLIQEALRQAAGVDGFCAEFGVFQGATLDFIARRIDRVAYGFDSFEGLPASWSTNVPKGAFNLGGAPPPLRLLNARLVKGWFSDAIPMFVGRIASPAAFLHLDCHLYESTRQVLDGLEARIGAGCVVVFGQYLNHPGWRDGQFRAFAEFCARSGRRYRYLGYTPTGTAVSLVIE